jgi:hypothetical protein
MPKTIDFPATREKLHTDLGEAQEELVSTESLLGGLTLDVELGSGSQADVDRARERREQLVSRVSGLQGALAKLDEREAEHVAAEAEAARTADLARIEQLRRDTHAAGAELLPLLDKLAGVLSRGLQAADEAAILGRRHDANVVLVTRWPMYAADVMRGRLENLAPGIGSHVGRDTLAKAEQYVTGKA